MEKYGHKSSKRLGLGAKPNQHEKWITPELASLQKNLALKQKPSKNVTNPQSNVESIDEGNEVEDSRFQMLDRNISGKRNKKSKELLDVPTNNYIKKNKRKKSKQLESQSEGVKANIQILEKPLIIDENKTSDMFSQASGLKTKDDKLENDMIANQKAKLTDDQPKSIPRRTVKIKYFEHEIERDGQMIKLTKRKTKTRSRQKNLKRDHRPEYLKPQSQFVKTG